MFFLEMMMVVMMWASFKYDDDEDNGYDHENEDEDDDDEDYDDDEDEDKNDADEPHFLRFLPARRNTGALPSSLSMWRKYVGNRPDDQWPFQSRFTASSSSSLDHCCLVVITFRVILWSKLSLSWKYVRIINSENLTQRNKIYNLVTIKMFGTNDDDEKDKAGNDDRC